MALAILATNCGTVYAGSGSGNENSSWQHVGCNKAPYHQNVKECDDNTGGASWHIFPINKLPAAFSTPAFKDRPVLNSAVSSGSFDGNIPAVCSNSSYYAAYVYDGWVGKGRPYQTVYYGPLAWKTFHALPTRKGDPIHYPVYHTRAGAASGGSHSYIDVVNAINSGVNINGWRVKGTRPAPVEDPKKKGHYIGTDHVFISEDADALWRLWRRDNSEIAPGTGYFCIDPIIKRFDAVSTIDIKVRKNGGAYTDDVLYAKPTDTIDFYTDYNPNAQNGYNRDAQNISINGGSMRPGGYSAFQKTQKLFGDYGGVGNWSNSFKVNATGFSYDSGSVNGAVGNAGKLTNNNSYNIASSNVGSELSEKATTDPNTPTGISVYIAPHVATPKKNKDYSVSAFITTNLADTAIVKVPYNFENKTEITTPDTELAFAGETKTFRYNLYVNPRQNKLVSDNYSTIVKEAKWKIGITFNADKTNINNYQWSSVREGSLNTDGNLNGYEKEESHLINIPDLNAGSEVCVRSAIFPRDSGDDDNMKPSANYDPNDPNAWFYSQERCYTIAKRPSIQAWGGNVFSGGSINAARSIKNNLYGYTGYHIENPQGTFVFGSWGELGVISNGQVQGFASGATLGYVSNSSGNLNPIPFANTLASSPNTRASVGNDPGGSSHSSFCDHSVLTIANDNCSSGTASGTGGRDSTESIKIDKNVLKALATDSLAEQDIPDNVINLEKLDNGIIYTGNSNITITGGTLPRHTFKVVSAKEGNITISGDIIIPSDETFEKFSHTPKAVIYAKNTIFIDCSVSRIDAILVANTIVTCNNLAGDGTLNDKNVGDRINDEKNSNQLIVNGAIVANRLYANRTYGAANGANSIVPAEIINFDPILYLWGGVASSKTDSGDEHKTINGNIETVNIHELSPRY